MIKTLDLSKFKTGIELEKEFNRIITLARLYKISHIEADKILDDIYNYGIDSGKFSKEDHKQYLKRKNYRRSGESRTHLEWALNLSNGQSEEHRVFFYFLRWVKRNKSEEVKKTIAWDFYGSDYKGYIIIINFKERGNCVNPDYKFNIGKTNYLIETKSFKTTPTLKIINLVEYINSKSFLLIHYIGRYYLFGTEGIQAMSKMKRDSNWGQYTIEVSQRCLDNFLKEDLVKEIKNVG